MALVVTPFVLLKPVSSADRSADTELIASMVKTDSEGAILETLRVLLIWTVTIRIKSNQITLQKSQPRNVDSLGQ